MRPQERDLFGQVPITHQDVAAWRLAVPRMDLAGPCAAWYVKAYSVPEKIAAAKPRGDFEQITALRDNPAHWWMRFLVMLAAVLVSGCMYVVQVPETKPPKQDGGLYTALVRYEGARETCRLCAAMGCVFSWPWWLQVAGLRPLVFDPFTDHQHVPRSRRVDG